MCTNTTFFLGSRCSASVLSITLLVHLGNAGCFISATMGDVEFSDCWAEGALSSWPLCSGISTWLWEFICVERVADFAFLLYYPSSVVTSTGSASLFCGWNFTCILSSHRQAKCVFVHFPNGNIGLGQAPTSLSTEVRWEHVCQGPLAGHLWILQQPPLPVGLGPGWFPRGSCQHAQKGQTLTPASVKKKL